MAVGLTWLSVSFLALFGLAFDSAWLGLDLVLLRFGLSLLLVWFWLGLAFGKVFVLERLVWLCF